MSMSLTSLPPELFCDVVANIKSPPTLCNLARCSRQLYLSTIPYLYRHVTVKERVQRGEKQNGRLQNLASLLIRRPDLAQLVRNFTLHTVGSFRMNEDTSWDSEAFEPFENYEEPEEHESSKKVNFDHIFKTAVTAGSLSEEEVDNRLKALSQTDKGYHDLFLALLLPALLKVEKLVLDVKFGFHTHYLERMIRRAAHREKPFDIQPPFEALKVFVHSPNNHYPYQQSINVISSLLKFPAIQEISASFGAEIGAYGERHPDKDPIELDSSSSSLTSLDLTARPLPKEDLHHMLRTPKALKTLSYKILSPGCINLIDIRLALEPQKNCLESLMLDFSTDDKRMSRRDYPLVTSIVPARSGPMTSFISFKNLKFLKIATAFLPWSHGLTKDNSLIDIFPPTLETLHVTDVRGCFADLVEVIDELLVLKPSQQIPLLKKLILDETECRFRMDTRLMDVQEAAIRRLSKEAAAHGVSIEIIELKKRTEG